MSMEKVSLATDADFSHMDVEARVKSLADVEVNEIGQRYKMQEELGSGGASAAASLAAAPSLAARLTAAFALDAHPAPAVCGGLFLEQGYHRRNGRWHADW